MKDPYEENAPGDIPSVKEQPSVGQQPDPEEEKIIPVKETFEQWKTDILDKIQYLKENVDAANRDKEALSQEIDRLKEELTNSKEHARELVRKLDEAMETFNNLLGEIGSALSA
jgi:FtsZ-binding cell division protein ZapB